MLGSIISKFDAEAKNHMEKQSLNPFSGSFSRSPSPRLSKDQYGRPVAGSKTEERGHRAKCHILREIQDLCNCIHDIGVYNKTNRPHDDSDDENVGDDEIIVSFGEIFQIYTKINDKVVGLLIAAKKRGFIFFEKEILFQRRDDDVLIALIKPIAKIRAIINKELAEHHSPTPFQSREVSPSIADNSESKQQTTKSVSEPSTSMSTRTENAKESATSYMDTSKSSGPNTETTNLPNTNSADHEQTSTPIVNSGIALPSDIHGEILPPPTNTNEIPEINCEISVTTNEISTIVSQIPHKVIEVSDHSDESAEKSCDNNRDAITSDGSEIRNDNVAKNSQNDKISEEMQTVEFRKSEEYEGRNGNVNEIDVLPTKDEEKCKNDNLLEIPRVEITFESEPDGKPADATTTTADVVLPDEPPKLEIADGISAHDTELSSTDPLENDKLNFEVTSNDSNTAQVVSSEHADSNILEETSDSFGVLTATEGVDNICLNAENQNAQLNDTETDGFQRGNNESDIFNTNTVEQNQHCFIENNSTSTTSLSKEMIENLSATIFERSSSPDPCDEEVQQILESQMSSSPIIETSSE